MSTISVSVPEPLRKKMRQRDDINWSSVARQAFEQRITDEEFLLDVAKRSQMTPAQVREMSIRINRLVSRKST